MISVERYKLQDQPIMKPVSGSWSLYRKSLIFSMENLLNDLFVSIRSTPYCISQKNIVPLHGGIIFLILRQEYEV